MKAIRCTRPGLIEMVERPVPEMAPGHVLVDVRFVGICGTDYHIYQGTHPFISYPLVLGHELSGTVNSADRDSGFEPGDPVVVNPYLACDTCQACRAGKSNCCETLEVLGIHTDGGMCSQIAVPAKNLISASGLELFEAAMVEYLAIGAHAVRRTGLQPKANVLVVGAGPIGLATAIFARIAGATVTLLDRVGQKLEAARAMGFSRTIEQGATENEEPSGSATTGFDAVFDAVFDATGNIAAMNQSIFRTCHGGAYTLVGVIAGDLVFPDAEVHRRELTIRGSRNATAVDFAHVIAAIKAGLVPTGALVTHRCTLDEVPLRLDMWARARADVIKAIVSV